MAAATLDITVEQGSTFNKTITLTDSLGAPINLTGYTARAQIRATPESATIIASFTVTVQAPPTAGILDWIMPAATTTTLVVDNTEASNPFKPTVRSYDLEIESGSGVVTRIFQGKAKIIPNVTR